MGSSYENNDLKDEQKKIDESASYKINLVILLLVLGAIVLGHHLYTTPIPQSRKPSAAGSHTHKIRK